MNDFRDYLCMVFREVTAPNNLSYDVNRRCGLPNLLDEIILYFPTSLIHCNTRQVIG